MATVITLDGMAVVNKLNQDCTIKTYKDLAGLSIHKFQYESFIFNMYILVFNHYIEYLHKMSIT